MKYYKAQGVCPCCDSEDIEFDGQEPCGETLGYRAYCLTCKAEFTEWYKIEYIETELDKPGTFQ